VSGGRLDHIVHLPAIILHGFPPLLRQPADGARRLAHKALLSRDAAGTLQGEEAGGEIAPGQFGGPKQVENIGPLDGGEDGRVIGRAVNGAL
jgi:hypothetical protein